jgi:hypothetical protein
MTTFGDKTGFTASNPSNFCFKIVPNSSQPFDVLSGNRTQICAVTKCNYIHQTNKAHSLTFFFKPFGGGRNQTAIDYFQLFAFSVGDN